MEGKIILEEHFSTEANNALWDAKGEESRNGRAYSQEVARRLLDSDLCLAEMDRTGIEHCVLSLTSPGVQGISDPRKAGEIAKSSNDHVSGIVKAHPDQFSAFAAVALQDPAAAAEELERCVGDLGFKGALINGYSNIGPDEDVQYLDEQPVWVFWERVARLQVPVYLHPREPLPSQIRAVRGYPELGGSAWAFGHETASHAVRLMLSGLFDTYPTLQLILGHLGEALPVLLPRMQHRLDEQREGEKGSRAKRRASHYFANHFWLTTSGHFHAKPLQNAIEQIGADRVLFSVDYPFEQMDTAARWFDDLLLTDETKLRIGRENANQLLSLGLGELSNSAVAGSSS